VAATSKAMNRRKLSWELEELYLCLNPHEVSVRTVSSSAPKTHHFVHDHQLAPCLALPPLQLYISSPPRADLSEPHHRTRLTATTQLCSRRKMVSEA